MAWLCRCLTAPEPGCTSARPNCLPRLLLVVVARQPLGLAEGYRMWGVLMCCGWPMAVKVLWLWSPGFSAEPGRRAPGEHADGPIIAFSARSHAIARAP